MMKKKFFRLMKKFRFESVFTAFMALLMVPPIPAFAADSGFIFNFDIGQMFGYSNSIISSFMPLVVLVVGIGIAYGVIRFVISLF